MLQNPNYSGSIYAYNDKDDFTSPCSPPSHFPQNPKPIVRAVPVFFFNPKTRTRTKTKQRQCHSCKVPPQGLANPKGSNQPYYNPTEPFCTSLITKLAQAQLLDPIHTLLQTLKHQHQNPQKRRCFSDDFFFTLIKLYAHVANRIDKAVETLLDMPNFHSWPSPRTFNFVLNVLVNARLYDVVREVYAAAPKLGVEIDACCLNILIKGLCERGQLDSAFEVFDEFPKLRLEPNARTFSTLMHGLCKKGKVEDAFGLLERMEQSGVCVDAVVFNVLIGGLRKLGRVEEGKEVLEMMVRRGCYPNGGTYQQVLYGLLDARRFGEAREIVERMVSEGIVPSFVSYKVLIVGLCEGGLVGEVDWALRHMVRQGFVPRMGMWRKIVKCVVSKEMSSCCASFDGILGG
ncbi:Tetratricopeptide-like helical domain superfamily [Sesbania bispinosa]|nr:Tetratricopeptide-like helical domain superfamily [Sesbania bispinosa]